MAVVFDARDVARLAVGKFFQDLKHGLRRSPLAEHPGAAPVFGHEPKDAEVAQRLARGVRNFFYVTEAALAVDERAFLLAPAGGGQNQVSFLLRLGRRESGLAAEEFQ